MCIITERAYLSHEIGFACRSARRIYLNGGRRGLSVRSGQGRWIVAPERARPCNTRINEDVETDLIRTVRATGYALDLAE